MHVSTIEAEPGQFLLLGLEKAHEIVLGKFGPGNFA